MMMDREFRKGLDDCLSRLSRGDDVRSCLEAYPQYADRLEPYLKSAATVRGLEIPQASSEAKQAARRKLMDALSERPTLIPVGPLSRLQAPLLRAGSVAAALLLFMVAAIGASAALDGGDTVHDVLNALHLPSPIGGDGDEDEVEAIEFSGPVISTSAGGLALRTDDDVVMVRYTEDTEFEGSDGGPAASNDVAVGMDAFVRVLPVDGMVIYDALLVRLMGEIADDEDALPEETPEPSPTPIPEKPVPEDNQGEKTATPTPEAAPDVWTDVAYEGKITSTSSASFVLKSGDASRTFEIDGETKIVGFLAAGVFADVSGWQRGDGTFLAAKVTTYPVDFWATVVAVSSSSLTVKIEGAGSDVIVYKDSETDMIGEPFAGVKVWVSAFKKTDGSYHAVWIKVKTTQFYGTVTAIDGSTYTVDKSGTTYTVTTDGGTEFVGSPVVGSAVTVNAYKMGDGTYLAYKITVDENVFTGVIDSKNLSLNTIWVDVGGTIFEVCIEFADVFGTLEEGATVEVHVGWIEGSTYFAQKVIVIV